MTIWRMICISCMHSNVAKPRPKTSGWCRFQDGDYGIWWIPHWQYASSPTISSWDPHNMPPDYWIPHYSPKYPVVGQLVELDPHQISPVIIFCTGIPIARKSGWWRKQNSSGSYEHCRDSWRTRRRGSEAKDVQMQDELVTKVSCIPWKRIGFIPRYITRNLRSKNQSIWKFSIFGR